MKKVLILSLLLLIGLVFSQILPVFFSFYENVSHIIKIGTMICLAFIMIHVGYEFEIEKNNLKQYGKDYLIAFTAATFPWILVAIYFVTVLIPESTPTGEAWVQSLLAARFAAPTSAGVLFSMLAAAGLATTWMFRKTRILAIFDDLDTVILMIPLQMIIIGFKLQLLFILVIMFFLVWLAWKYLDRIKLSIRWKNVILYSVLIAAFAEVVYFTSKIIDETVSVHIEVLLPAFVLGTMISKNHNKIRTNNKEEDILELKNEKKVSFLLSAVFMVLVGLSMPMIEGLSIDRAIVEKVDNEIMDAYVRGDQNMLGMGTEADGLNWSILLFHVLIVTLLSNIGKIMPAFFYRNEASWRERLAVAISMFPRGEVGAGVLIISMSYGISGMVVSVSMLSLALNLLLTGVFIIIVKRLLNISSVK
ncbi:MAG: cation:proton antiporter [Bacteroidales bacterium]|nr:cation:proton antiporter [Bacteroidales bacterium]MCF8388585.1 cation:proton antiporter [Bacteroidales bacterium]